MTGKDQQLAALLVLAFCFILIAIGAATCGAPHALADRRVDDTQLVLARAAVAECGWQLPDCHAAVWHSFDNRIRRLRRRGNLAPEYGIRELARNYCTALKSDPRTERQIWIQSLPTPSPSAPEPAGWPEDSRWDKHLPLWKGIYDRAGAFLSGSLADPCEAPAFHFGGDMDAVGPKKQGWEKVDCGVTCTQDRCQHFWR